MPTADEDSTKLMKKIIKKLDFAWDADKIENPGTGCCAGVKMTLCVSYSCFCVCFFLFQVNACIFALLARMRVGACVNQWPPLNSWSSGCTPSLLWRVNARMRIVLPVAGYQPLFSPAHAMSHLNGLR